MQLPSSDSTQPSVSAARRAFPFASLLVCLFCATSLGFHGIKTLRIANANGETGEGLLGVMMVALACWALVAAAASFRFLRRARELSQPRYAAYAVGLTVFGIAPPLLGTYVFLMAWSATY